MKSDIVLVDTGLVGTRQGQRVVKWPAFISRVIFWWGVKIAAFYLAYLLIGFDEHFWFILGCVTLPGMLVILQAGIMQIRRELKTPLEQLPSLDKQS